jgi:hypothetical protein
MLTPSPHDTIWDHTRLIFWTTMTVAAILTVKQYGQMHGANPVPKVPCLRIILASKSRAEQYWFLTPFPLSVFRCLPLPCEGIRRTRWIIETATNGASVHGIRGERSVQANA